MKDEEYETVCRHVGTCDQCDPSLSQREEKKGVLETWRGIPLVVKLLAAIGLLEVLYLTLR
jgi:hypothetical protein